MDAAATADVDRQRLLKALQAILRLSEDQHRSGGDRRYSRRQAGHRPWRWSVRSRRRRSRPCLEAADLAERSRVATALLELGAFAGQDEGPRH